MKTLTRKQLESRKARAVRFTRDVREDDDRADEIEDESLEEYAQERRVKLLNSNRGKAQMPTPTRSELLERIEELEQQNDDLQGQLDEIADIVSPDEGNSEDDDQGEE